MKSDPTLADAAIRESLRPGSLNVPKRIGQEIAAARKFVLDKDSSAFLSDLSHASFVTDAESAVVAAERLRQLARLPHATTWVEYDTRAFRSRTLQVYDKTTHHVLPEVDAITGKVVARATKPSTGEDIVPSMGWLLQEFGQTFVLTTVVGGVAGSPPLVLPCAMAWTSDDTVPIIPRTTPADGPSDSRITTGIPGYNVPNVVIGTVPERNNISVRVVTETLVEWMGELRFVWALLAAVNDIPVGVKQVKPSKGFVARGRYRRFVEHSVISILIPKGRDPVSFARAVVALARRRAHMVRGHWRRNWRKDDGRIWIREHQRGDASLGFVMHDYKVEHEKSA